MDDNDAIQFYEDVLEGREKSRTISLRNRKGNSLDVEAHILSRKSIVRELKRIPDDVLEVMHQAESFEDADEEAIRQASPGAGIDDELITAFENILKKSLFHPDLPSDYMDDIISDLDFAVLFQLGGEVIDWSFEEQGKIEDFQIRSTDRNSSQP